MGKNNVIHLIKGVEKNNAIHLIKGVEKNIVIHLIKGVKKKNVIHLIKNFMVIFIVNLKFKKRLISYHSVISGTCS